MAETTTQPQGLLDADDMARLYRVHPDTIRAWSRLGRIPRPVVQQRKFTRWDAVEAHKHIASLRTTELQEAAS